MVPYQLRRARQEARRYRKPFLGRAVLQRMSLWSFNEILLTAPLGRCRGTSNHPGSDEPRLVILRQSLHCRAPVKSHLSGGTPSKMTMPPTTCSQVCSRKIGKIRYAQAGNKSGIELPHLLPSGDIRALSKEIMPEDAVECVVCDCPSSAGASAVTATPPLANGESGGTIFKLDPAFVDMWLDYLHPNRGDEKAGQWIVPEEKQPDSETIYRML